MSHAQNIANAASLRSAIQSQAHAEQGRGSLRGMQIVTVDEGDGLVKEREEKATANLARFGM